MHRLPLRICAAPIFALALLVQAPAALAQNVMPPPTNAPTASETGINVNGTARVFRKPDYVDVSIAVHVEEKTASAANSIASENMSKVIAAIKKLGLAGQELQTGSVQLNPRYDTRNHDGTDEYRLLGYNADISLRIRTTDINSVPAVLDTAITAGANRIEQVEFGIKEAIEAREEAIRLASQAATRKADVLAESLSLRVTRIISAGSTTQQYSMWNRNYGNRMMAQMTGDAGGGGESAESPVVPGQIEVWAQVDLQVAATAR